MTASYLYDVATGVLETCLDALTIDRTGRKPPSRTNVAWGNPPADTFDKDGQLTVALDPLGQGGSLTFLEQNPMMDSLIVPRATFLITLLRPVPSMDAKGNPAPSQALDSSAASLMTDLWAIMTQLFSAMHMHTVFPGQSPGNDVKIGRVDMIQPSGGVAGFNVRLDILLSDAGPVIGS